MNPHKMQPYIDAQKIRIRMQDEQMWHMGIYIQSAVAVATEHIMAGKKAKSKYIEKPLMSQTEETLSEELTEEEKRKQTEQLFMKLKIMQTNYELSHKDSMES